MGRKKKKQEGTMAPAAPRGGIFRNISGMLRGRGIARRLGAVCALVIFVMAMSAGLSQQAEAESGILGYTKISLSSVKTLTETEVGYLNGAGYGGGNLSRTSTTLYTMTTDSTDGNSHVFCTNCGLHAHTNDVYSYTSTDMSVFCDVSVNNFWTGRAIKWYVTEGQGGVDVGTYTYTLRGQSTSVYIGSISATNTRMLVQGFVWGLNTGGTDAKAVIKNMALVLGYNETQSAAIAEWLYGECNQFNLLESGFIYTYVNSSCPNGASSSNHQIFYGWKDGTTVEPVIAPVSYSDSDSEEEWMLVTIKKTEKNSGDAIDTATFEVLIDGAKLSSSNVKSSKSGQNTTAKYGSYNSSDSTFTTEDGIVRFWYKRTYTVSKSSTKYYVVNWDSISTYWQNYYKSLGYYKTQALALSAAKQEVADDMADALDKSLEATHTWKVTETGAPSGYSISSSSQSITETSTMTGTSKIGAITVSDSKTQAKGFTFKNTQKYAAIKLVKTYDKTAVKTSASMKDAVYTVYAGEDGIVSYYTGEKVTYNKGDVITTIKTKSNGKRTSEACLPCGYSYYVKETSAPAGYEKDTNTYWIKITYSMAGGTWAVRYKTKTNTASTTGSWSSSWTQGSQVPVNSVEQPTWGYVRVLKRVTDGYGKTSAETSAEFKVLNSAGKKAATLTYSGRTETGSDGYKYAVYTSTTKLPYGTYTIQQTKGTKTAEFHDDATVTISSGQGVTKEVWWNNKTITWDLTICKRVQVAPASPGAGSTYTPETSAKFTLYVYDQDSSSWQRVSEKTCNGTTYTTSGGNTYATATWTGLKADRKYKIVQTGGSSNSVYSSDITNIQATVSGHAVSGYKYTQDGVTQTKTSTSSVLRIALTNKITWIEIYKRWTNCQGTSYAETTAEFEIWDETTNKKVQTLTTSTEYTKSNGYTYGWAVSQALNPEHTYKIVQKKGVDNTKKSSDITGIDLSDYVGKAYSVTLKNEWNAGKITIYKQYEKADGTFAAEYDATFQVINSSGSVVATLTTSGRDKSGYGSATTGWLEPGTYTLHQTVAHADTEKVDDSTVTVTAGCTPVVKTFTNKSSLTPTSVEIYKEWQYLDDGGTIVTGAESGAVFKVINASYVSETMGTLTNMDASERVSYVNGLGSGAVAATLTTDSDGYAYATLGTLSSGQRASYVLLQVSGMSGYALSEAEAFTVTSGGSTKNKTFELVNKKYSAYISLYKEVSRTSTGGTVTEPEDGAVFQVLRASLVGKTAAELTAMNAAERTAYVKSLPSGAVAAVLTTDSKGNASALFDLTERNEDIIILQTAGYDGYAIVDAVKETAVPCMTFSYEKTDPKYETFISVLKKTSETVEEEVENTSGTVTDTEEDEEDEEDDTEEESEEETEEEIYTQVTSYTLEAAEEGAVFYILRTPMLDATTEELTNMTAEERQDYVYGLIADISGKGKSDIEEMTDDEIAALIGTFLTSDAVAAVMVTAEDGTASGSVSMATATETLTILQTRGRDGYAVQDAEEFTGEKDKTLEYDRVDPKYEFYADITKTMATYDTASGEFTTDVEEDAVVFILRKNRLTALKASAQETLDTAAAQGTAAYNARVAVISGIDEDAVAAMTESEVAAAVKALGLGSDDILELEMLYELTEMTLSERIGFVAGLLGTTADAMENMTNSEIEALIEADASNVAGMLVTDGKGTDRQLISAVSAKETFFLLQTATADGYSYNDAEAFTYVYQSEDTVTSEGSESAALEGSGGTEEETVTAGVSLTLQWTDIDKRKTASVTKTLTDINGENEQEEEGAVFTILYLEDENADADAKASELSAFTYAGARQAYLDGLEGNDYVFWGELDPEEINALDDELYAEYLEEEEQSYAAWELGAADQGAVTAIISMTTDAGGLASCSFSASAYPNTFIAYQTDGKHGYRLLEAVPSTSMEVDDEDEYNTVYSFSGTDRSTMYVRLGVIKYYDVENGDENTRWVPEEGATFDVLLEDGTVYATITTGADGYGVAVDSNGDVIKFPVDNGVAYIIHQTGGAANHEFAEDEDFYFAADQDRQTIYYECRNESKDTKLMLTKVSADTGADVRDAEYTIYAAGPVYGTDGSLLYAAGDKVAVMSTGQYSAAEEEEDTPEAGIEGTEAEKGTDDDWGNTETAAATGTYENETADAGEGTTWYYLPYGSYYIYETDSPHNFVRSTERTDLTITAKGITYRTGDGDTVTGSVAYTADGTAYVEMELSDEPVYGEIYVSKDGTALSGADLDGYTGTVYDTEAVSGGTYAVYASETIYDDAGNVVKYIDPDDDTVKEMTEGSLLGYVTTDDAGQAQFTWLKVTDRDVEAGTDISGLTPEQYEETSQFYLGNYTVKETEAPYGRVLDENEYLVTLTYDHTAENMDDGEEAEEISGTFEAVETYPYRSSGPYILETADESDYNGGFNAVLKSLSGTITAVDFTTTTMTAAAAAAAGYTWYDVSSAHDGTVILWVSDNTAYISANTADQFVFLNACSAELFSGCSFLTSITFENADTSLLVDATSMFYNCKALTVLDLSHWDTSNLLYVGQMFKACARLKTIYASDIILESDDGEELSDAYITAYALRTFMSEYTSNGTTVAAEKFTYSDFGYLMWSQASYLSGDVSGSITLTAGDVASITIAAYDDDAEAYYDTGVVATSDSSNAETWVNDYTFTMTVCITFAGNYKAYDPAYVTVTVECPDMINVEFSYTEDPEVTVTSTNNAQTIEIQVGKVDNTTDANNVEGAVIGLYANCTILDYDGNVLFKAGDLIMTAESGGEGYGAMQFTNLPSDMWAVDGTYVAPASCKAAYYYDADGNLVTAAGATSGEYMYYIKEISAPLGYKAATGRWYYSGDVTCLGQTAETVLRYTVQADEPVVDEVLDYITLVKAWDDSQNLYGDRPEWVGFTVTLNGAYTYVLWLSGNTAELYYAKATYQGLPAYYALGSAGYSHDMFTNYFADALIGTWHVTTSSRLIGEERLPTWEVALKSSSFTKTKGSSYALSPEFTTEAGTWKFTEQSNYMYKSDGTAVGSVALSKTGTGYKADGAWLDASTQNVWAAVNTYYTVDHKVDVSLTKYWDDWGDEDGVRPDSITVALYRQASGGSVEAVDKYTLAADDAITAESGNLDNVVYKSTNDDGNTWTLLITELDRYADDDNTDEYTYWFSEVSASWDGKSYNAGSDGTLRSGDYYTVDNMESSEAYNDGTVNKETGAECTWYSEITNTHDVSLGLTLTKTWNTDNPEAEYPESITFIVKRISKGTSARTVGTITLTADDADASGAWVGKLGNLDKYDNYGNEYEYYVEEDRETAGSFDVLYEGTAWNADTGMWDATVVNTDELPETVESSVQKVWDDCYQSKFRPNGVYVRLIAEGSSAGIGTVTYMVVELNSDGNWKYTAENLPKYDSDGTTLIQYSWEEVLDGEEITVSTKGIDSLLGVREENLKENEDVYVTYTYSGTDGVKITDGTDVSKGYVISYSYGSWTENGYGLTTVTNTYRPQTKVTVTKEWITDGAAQAADCVYVKLVSSVNQYRMSAVYTVVELSELNGWTATVSGLPVYYNSMGSVITYTWEECYAGEAVTIDTRIVDAGLGNTADSARSYTVPGGTIEGLYDTALDEERGDYTDGDGWETYYETEGTATTVTNVRIRTTEASIEKVWADYDNEEGLRPDAVYVALVASFPTISTETVQSTGSETVYKVIRLNEDNGWSYTEEGLPVYDTRGYEIEYYWVELYSGQVISVGPGEVTQSLMQGSSESYPYTVPDDTMEGYYDMDAGTEYGDYDNENGYWATYVTEGTATTLTNSLVRPGSITVKKLNAAGGTISGVEFTLYEATAITDAEAENYGITGTGQTVTAGGRDYCSVYSGGNWYIYGGTGTVATTDENGEAVWEGITPGIYAVAETGTANGYSLLKEPFVAEIPLTVSDEDVDTYGYDTSGKNTVHLKAKGQWLFYDLTYKVTDTAVLALPKTGSGAIPAVAAIVGLAAVAVAVLRIPYGRRKKKKAGAAV